MTYNENQWVVEPCNVTIINCIESINLANIPGHVCENKDVKTIIVDKEGIDGDVKLDAGFNCTLEGRNGVFTIGSVEGGGACLTEGYCTGNLLEVANSCTMCDETVKAINGVNGKTINIQGGPGVTVTCKDNTVYLSLDTQIFKQGCETEDET